LGNPSKIAPTTHLEAMPYLEVPAFLATLRTQDGIPAKALEFVILTAARSAEVFGAKWSEFDLQAAMWIVPSHRQKSRREHRVPLSKQALALIRGLPTEPNNEHVFIGFRCGRPIAEDGMRKTLHALRPDVDVHGFRTSIRNYAAEVATNIPSKAAEQALAHRVGGATQRAYFRSDQYALRGKLLQQGANFIDAPPVTADVTPLRRA
jgi:integrase